MNSIETDLLDASEASDMIKVMHLLREGASINAECENSGMTVLHWAGFNGLADIAALLLKNGADVNAKNKGGWTPLHWAVANGHTATAALFIRNGADVRAQDNEGKTAFDYAHEMRRMEIEDLLRMP